jgi:hypothetical protein
MILSTLLLTLTLAAPANLPAVADTIRAPKPQSLAPTIERRKPEPRAPTIERRKPQPPPKGKPVGEPQLKRRKPPPLDLLRIR